MYHSIPIPMIFVSAIFARLSRRMMRTTLTAKMALTAKMCDCSRFMAWITLTAKMAANGAHKKSRTQFWLSETSGIIYHLWFR
jgi:hypothetical protein